MGALLAIAVVASLFDVPAVFGGKLATARDRTDVPILLPQTIRTDARRLYGRIDRRSTGRRRYGLSLTSRRRCGAGCAVASFGGIRGGGVIGGERVDLARGRQGRYHPAPARRIEWHERGTVYVLTFPEAAGKADLIALANSAIRHGPR